MRTGLDAGPRAAALTGLTYAEFTSRYPRAGGAAHFVQTVFRTPLLTFLVMFGRIYVGAHLPLDVVGTTPMRRAPLEALRDATTEPQATDGTVRASASPACGTRPQPT